MQAQDSVSAQLTTLSWRLLIATGAMFLLTTALFLVPMFQFADRFPVSWLCFGVGVLGGFVSIQQRLKFLSQEEVDQLAQSWVHVFMIPLFGGIFALLLYMIMLSGIVGGAAFPAFVVAEFSRNPTVDDIRAFFTETYPASGEDFAKLVFWSFVAGFSERFVPNICHGSMQQADLDQR